MTVSLEAEIAIRRLHALCADAVWRKDRVAFAECYANDAVWKIAGLELHGRAAIGQALGNFGAANERVLMVFGAPILTMNEDVLTGRTYAVEHVKLLDGSAVSTIGIYYERFIVRGGRWLFHWRHFDFAYHGPPDLSASFYPSHDYGPPSAMPPADAMTGGLQFKG